MDRSGLEDLMQRFVDLITPRVIAKVLEQKKAAPTSEWVEVRILPGAHRAKLDACRSGDLPARKSGRRWVCRLSDYEAWLQRGTMRKKTPPAPQSGDDVADLRHALGLRAVRKVG